METFAPHRKDISMSKENYELLKMEIVRFEAEDVITTSDGEEISGYDED